MRRADEDAGDIGDEVFHHGVSEPLIVVNPFRTPKVLRATPSARRAGA